MSTGDAGGSSGNGANSGSGAGIPSAVDSVNVDALVNEAVNKALSARLKRLNLDEQVGKAVEAALSKMNATPADKTQEQAPTANGGESAATVKEQLKALQEALSRTQKQLADQADAAKKAQEAARDTRLRAEFSSKLAAKVGADNPLLGTLVDSLYDVKKRITEQNGQTGIVFRDAYGVEDWKPLDEGVSALFDGELKHLVQQSKAANLPPSNVFRGAHANGSGGQQPVRNSIYGEIAKSALGENPALAAALLNGSPQK